MAQTPDLSSIVNIIMQNPALIEQISALANPKTESDATPMPEENVEIKEEPKVDAAAPASVMRAHRHELLNAMKPYLSEGRRTAIDSMTSILDVIDVIIKKQ